MINQYSNSNQILKEFNPGEGLRFTSDDASLLKGVLFNPKFGNSISPNTNSQIKADMTELHVYSRQGGYLNSQHDIDSWDTVVRPGDSAERKVRLDVHNDIRSLGYERGQYKIIYNFFKNQISSNKSLNKLFIYDVSPSRTELKIKASDPECESLIYQINEFFSTTFPSTEYKNLFALNFGDNAIVPIINMIQISDVEFWVKLYEPLTLELGEGKSCWLVNEIRPPYTDNIILLPEVMSSTGNKLKGPNFDVDVEYDNISATNLKNWNDLLSESSQTSQQLIDQLFSGSLSGVKLNVRFNEWGEFIHFSSAEERLKNFIYKVRLIETYDNQLGGLDNVVGSLGGNRITTVQNRNKIISGFDDFERWLYFDIDREIYTYPGSSSVTPYPKQEVTPSTGSTWQNAYQAWYEANITFDDTNDVLLSSYTFPYQLYSVTSSQAQDWINDKLTLAIEYDRENIHSLRQAIPHHIIEDTLNDQFTLFVDMLGHHFDINWLYIKHLTKTHTREEHPEDGISNDLLYDVAESFGWSLAHGTQTTDLWLSMLGTDSNLNMQVSGSSGVRTKPYEQRTKEVWRRIVNNLPYILKTKGTERSVKALLSCYGIPSSILYVKEYGGPKQNDLNRLDLINNKFRKQTLFTANGETIRIPIDKHYNVNTNTFDNVKQVEFRVGTNDGDVFNYDTYGPHVVAEFLGSGDALRGYIQIEPTSSISTNTKQLCNVHMYSSYGGAYYTQSIESVKLLDGGFFNIQVGFNTQDTLSTSDDFDLEFNVAKKKWNKIILDTGSTLTLTSGDANHNTVMTNWLSLRTLKLGGSGYTNPHTGSIEDIRVWIGSFGNEEFLNHTLSAKAYDGLSGTSSFYDLVGKYDLADYNGNYPTSSFTIGSVHPNQSITGSENYNLEATLTNFTSQSLSGYVEEMSFDVPSGGNTNFRSTKIRIEDQTLYKRLSPEERSTVSEFDRQPTDSDRLDVAFSPQNIINEDIISHIGNTNLDDYIGNPLDIYREEYPELEDFSVEYWKKYENKNDFNVLFKMLSKYDFSIFSQIKQVLPQRANKVLGVVVEPNILERNRIRTAIRPQLFETKKVPIELELKMKEITGDSNDNADGQIDSQDLFTLEGASDSNLTGLINGDDISKLTNIQGLSNFELGLLLAGNLDRISSIVRTYAGLFDNKYYDDAEYCHPGIRHVSGSGWIATTSPPYKCRYTGSVVCAPITNAYWKSYDYIYDSGLSGSLGLYSSRSLSDSDVNEDYKSLPIGTRRYRYEGSTLSGQINQPSDSLPDGSPIIEVFQVNPNELKYQGDNNPSGSLSVE